MTSQKSSVNKMSSRYDLKQAFLSCIPFGAVMLAVLFLPFVINISGELSVFSEFLEKNKLELVTVNLLSEYSAPSVQIMLVLLGAFFALTNLYILKKQSVNFYLSSPVNRSALFKNRVIASVCTMAAVLAVVVMIDVFMNVTTLKANAGFIVQMALALYAEALVYLLASYTIVTIGIYSCYTIVEGLFFGGALLVLPTAVCYVVDAFCSAFLAGYGRPNAVFYSLLDVGLGYGSTFQDTTLIEKLSGINPFFIGQAYGQPGLTQNIFTLSHAGQSVMEYYDLDETIITPEGTNAVLPDISYILPLLLWAAAVVIGLVFARALFIRRKAENTSIHGANPVATHIFALELGFGAAGVMAYGIAGLREESSGYSPNNSVGLFYCVLAFALVTLIVTAVSKRQAIFKNKKEYFIPLAGTAVVLVAGVILSAGGLGYSSYAPALDKIESATITNGSLTSVFFDDATIDDYYGETPAFSVEHYSEGLAVFTEKEDIEKLISVQKQFEKSNDRSGYSEVYIIYLLKDGSRVVRRYSLSMTQEESNALLSLTDTKAYKEELSALLLGTENHFVEKANKIASIDGYISDAYDEESYQQAESSLQNVPVRIDYFNSYLFGKDGAVAIENTKELRQALYDDLISGGYQARFRNKDEAICNISFGTSREDYITNLKKGTEAYEDSHYAPSHSYRVYPSMTKTVAYLKSVGAVTGKENPFGVEPIEAYVVKIADYFDNMNYRWYMGNLHSTVFSGYITENVQYEGEEYESYVDDAVKMYFKTKAVTDKEALKQLEGKSKSKALAGEDDYLVAYRVKNADGKDYFEYMLIYSEDM